MKNGFTLIELLIVIAIVGILSSTVINTLGGARNKAHLSRALADFNAFNVALQMYLDEHDGVYPPDTSRDLPAEVIDYFASGTWPRPSWPGSVYDWENWDDPDNPGERIYQVSIRFCPAGGDISTCVFPNESWASDFDVNSSVYYCIDGSCRAHVSEVYNYPGFCVNCATQPSDT